MMRPDQEKNHKILQAYKENIIDFLNGLPSSRERSIAITEVEKALIYATYVIDRSEPPAQS